MSVVLETLDKVHDKQVDAATRSQELVIAAVDKVAKAAAGLREKAPSVPEQVARPVAKITAPVAKTLGSPTDYVAYAAKSARDWAQVQQKLQAAFIDAVAPAAPAKPVDSTPSTAAKKA